jgi:hypothetical protein
MRVTAARIGAGMAAALLLVAGACNRPQQRQEETRAYPKAPLTEMAPIIRQEPTTQMSRLAHLNRPRVVEIPVDSVTPAPR